MRVLDVVERNGEEGGPGQTGMRPPECVADEIHEENGECSKEGGDKTRLHLIKRSAAKRIFGIYLFADYPLSKVGHILVNDGEEIRIKGRVVEICRLELGLWHVRRLHHDIVLVGVIEGRAVEPQRRRGAEYDYERYDMECACERIPARGLAIAGCAVIHRNSPSLSYGMS